MPYTSRRKRRSAVVPGQFFGYAVQELRVAAHLFAAASDDDVVSLEVIGDTALHAGDGTIRTEEHKSRTSSSNPVADMSTDLWKTLRNWVEAVERGELDPARTTFCLHLSSPFHGDIVERLHQARDQREAGEALEYAARQVWRTAEGTSLLQTLPVGAREHVTVVFSADSTTLASIVAHFILEFGSGDAWSDLRKAAAVAAVEPELLDDCLRDLVGWVKQKLTDCVQQRRAAAILAGEFRTHLRAIRRRMDSQLVLVSAAPGPDALAIQRHLRAVQTYVRQLELIDATEDEKLEAASDYLRASNDRVAWAKRGLVHQTSFNEFETDLESTWRRKKRSAELRDAKRPAAERGMLLYLECCEHSAKLNGLEPPSAFCRGSFHALADHLRIGWHPDYMNALRAPAAKARTRNRDSSRSGR